MGTTVEVAGESLHIDPLRPFDRLIYKGIFERSELRLIDQLIATGDVCVDVGANIGLYSILCVGRSRTGTLIAFEPSQSFTRLRSNLSAWENAIPLNIGISNENGTLNLGLTRDDGDEHASFREGGTEGNKIAVKRLDDVPEIASLSGIDFLKIDVEGWERQVMTGAAELWRRRAVGIALIEANSQLGSVDYLRELIDLGYSCFRIQEVLRTLNLRRRLKLTPLDLDSHLPQANVLVVRPDRLSRLLQVRY